MLRTSKFLPLLTLLAAGTALAQQQAPATPPAAPQQVEPIEKGAEPPLIPPKEPTTRIVEKKVGGEVVEATVTAGPSTYTLRPNKPVGTAEVGEVSAGPSRAPTWSILQFGTRKPKPAEETAREDDKPASRKTTVRAGEMAPVPPPPRPDVAPVK